MDWQTQLISLYVFVSKNYSTRLKFYCERMTNYADLTFSDEEVITIFLFGILRKFTTIKTIYGYIKDHLSGWFPLLPSYTAFVQRLNKVSDVFIPLIQIIKSERGIAQIAQISMLMDSMPIVLARGGRRFSAKVANEIATPNGYCATKKMYYYGVKLHVAAERRNGKLPIPEYIGITEAGMNDRKAYEQILPELSSCCMYADKAYQIGSKPIFREQNVVMNTPVKKAKGQKHYEAAEKLLSSAISSMRQPIESFFSWLEEKTSIQMAGKIRSYRGLMVHVFGRLAAAMFLLMMKFSS